MYATACSHCAVWRQVCFRLMAGSFYYKFVWRRECGTAIDPPNLLMEGGRCKAPYYSPAAEQVSGASMTWIPIVFMVFMAWYSLLEFCSCAPLIQICRQRVGNMISCCSYFGLDFVVKITTAFASREPSFSAPRSGSGYWGLRGGGRLLRGMELTAPDLQTRVTDPILQADVWKHDLLLLVFGDGLCRKDCCRLHRQGVLFFGPSTKQQKVLLNMSSY